MTPEEDLLDHSSPFWYGTFSLVIIGLGAGLLRDYSQFNMEPKIAVWGFVLIAFGIALATRGVVNFRRHRRHRRAARTYDDAT